MEVVVCHSTFISTSSSLLQRPDQNDKFPTPPSPHEHHQPLYRQASMAIHNTPQTFAAVFRDFVVPTIMEEVETTGIYKHTGYWLNNVCYPALA
jgi:hypothetical protein